MNLKYVKIMILLTMLTTSGALVLSSDKIAAAFAALPITLAAISVLFSADSAQKNHEQTEKTLKLTEKTLKLTEIEQQKRDIEKRLDFFYYPISNYFRIAKQHPQKTGLEDRNMMKDRLHAESFRYLADEKTRKQIEIWRTDRINKVVNEVKLIKYINTDIEEYEKQIQELHNQRDIIENGAKNPDI